jgi:hypothetical protein
MLTISEMIVLLWLMPVVANIILPLAFLFFWSVGRLFHVVGRATSSAESDATFAQERQVLSTGRN